MSESPKLKVMWSLGYPGDETTCDLEEAKDLVFGYGPMVLVFVEGQMVNSYEELVQLVTQSQFKDKEMLNVRLLVMGIGGG